MKKILLIEDNDDIRNNTAEILELADYTVFTAANGMEGIGIALKEIPDLVVSDIMMPGLDGYGVLHLLRKNPQVKHVPFIFLTAKAERHNFRKAMELGADDYISKPFTGTELLNAVETRLKKSTDNNAVQLLDATIINSYNDVSEGEVIQKFTNHRELQRFKKKQQIYLQGSRPSKLFFIKKGKVKTFKTNDDGKELVLGLYNENEFLGYRCLFDNSQYKETAEAMEDTELAIIPRKEFEALINGDHVFSSKFIKLMAAYISETEDHLAGLAYNSLRKKVAEALIMLQKKYKVAGQDYKINLTRDNLASIAGTATESLIRTLGDFKTEQLIEIEGGVITIINERKLENLHN